MPKDFSSTREKAMWIEPEISGSSIVLLGDFNPAIFSPSWFAKYGIVSQSAADEAETTVIHPELAVMQIGSKSIKVEKKIASLWTRMKHHSSISQILS